MSITIQIEISDDDKTVLDHTLLDIKEWIQGAVDGKIHTCRCRMAMETTELLKADKTVHEMPATDIGLVKALTMRSDYKNRRQKEKMSNNLQD